jgi:hypothetical protein
MDLTLQVIPLTPKLPRPTSIDGNLVMVREPIVHALVPFILQGVLAVVVGLAGAASGRGRSSTTLTNPK